MMAARFGMVAATAGLLSAAAFPFIVLVPDPPAFGPESLGIVAMFAITATLATACRTECAGRRRILRRAGMLFGVTAAATVSNKVLPGRLPLVPTLDLLPALFGLNGEHVDTALLFEAWCELWLIWALAAALLDRCVVSRPTSAPRVRSPWDEPVRDRPWNPATILLWAVGWCAMAGAIVVGHRTADFLDHAVHVPGTIADEGAHPLIRFTTADGRVVTFRQNGDISRAVGATVPVAYDPSNPAATAQAATFFATWGNVSGLVWVGLGFTLFPFFGMRAAFDRR